MSTAARYLGIRAANGLLTLVGLFTIVFFIMKVAPGDEARAAAGRNANAEQIQAMRDQLGLDEPLFVQYLTQLGRLFTGDLGRSTRTLQPVSSDLAAALPATIELVVAAFLLALIVGTATGVIAAARRGGGSDTSLRLLAVLAGGIPAFWLAYLLQYSLGAQLQVLPVSGQLSSGVTLPRVTGFTVLDAFLAGRPEVATDAIAHLVLPAVVVSLAVYAGLFRMLRASMVSTLTGDYIDAVRAKGAGSTRVLVGHALRNSALPVVTLLGLQVGWTIGGIVLVETVFAWPGIGSYLSSAIIGKDVQAVFGTVLFVGIIVVLCSLAVDIIQLLIDPRIRHRRIEVKA
ncbi:ABC transporter permease [Microbacterium lacus]|uniref:ABC transporter permease n=1 Tax=Microbacterium lacus TaxID=415217 RepID=UPI00384C5093